MSPLTWITQIVLSSTKKANGDWDEIQIAGFVCLMVMCVNQTINLLWWHGEFSPTAFGGGCAAIITAMAGGKTVRDRWSCPPKPNGDEHAVDR